VGACNAFYSTYADVRPLASYGSSAQPCPSADHEIMCEGGLRQRWGGPRIAAAELAGTQRRSAVLAGPLLLC
jgi:hypothetical protein